MATKDPRARIMSHMNKEHGADLERYLRAFNGVPAPAARGAQLTDLSLTTLTIATSSSGAQQQQQQQHSVEVTPPMKSLADARERFVAMAARARERLGLGDVRVTKCAAPRGLGLFTFLGVAFYFVSAAALAAGFLRPENPALWGVLDACFPYRGAEGFVWSVRTIALPVAVIHCAEAWHMARSRLGRYGVEIGGGVWWLWVLKTFVEGFPAFAAFDALVAEERAKKDAVKH